VVGVSFPKALRSASVRVRWLRAFPFQFARKERMLIKCECEHCHVNIEFDHESFLERGRNAKKIIGQEVQCPVCHKNTILYLPNNQYAETKANKLNDWKIERNLEGIGVLFFWLGIIGLVGGGMIFIGMMQPGEDGQSAFLVLCCAIAAFFQGCILLVIFKALAEIIRLLRKIAAKT
jgi:hypothetical protein